jgi:hypothetical protein
MNAALQPEEGKGDQRHRHQAEPNHQNTKTQIVPHWEKVNWTGLLCDVQFVPVRAYCGCREPEGGSH